MNETEIIRDVLRWFQSYPEAFSLISLGLFTLTGYLLSRCCMNCLKKRFGHVEEGLTEAEIREIVEEERQRRRQKQNFKSGSKESLTPQEEKEIQKRVEVYKARIAKLMEEGKKQQ